MSWPRRTFFSALPLALPSLAAAQGKLDIPAKWYAVKVEGDAFIVQMPGIPDHKLLSDVSARGTAFMLHSYSLEVGGNSYVAQTAEFPPDVDYKQQPKSVLQAALDTRARQLNGGKWAKTQWSEIDGAAAVDSSGPLSNGSNLRQLVTIKEARFVSLAFMGPNVGGADANRYFKSLKIK